MIRIKCQCGQVHEFEMGQINALKDALITEHSKVMFYEGYDPHHPSNVSKDISKIIKNDFLWKRPARKALESEYPEAMR